MRLRSSLYASAAPGSDLLSCVFNSRMVASYALAADAARFCPALRRGRCVTLAGLFSSRPAHQVNSLTQLLTDLPASPSSLPLRMMVPTRFARLMLGGAFIAYFTGTALLYF